MVLENLTNRYLFDEKSHTYYYNGEKVNTSVTTFISKYWPKFELEKISYNYAVKNGLSQAEVKDA